MNIPVATTYNIEICFNIDRTVERVTFTTESPNPLKAFLDTHVSNGFLILLPVDESIALLHRAYPIANISTISITGVLSERSATDQSILEKGATS